VTGGQRIADPGPQLVPGELRGYRQFQLRGTGLYPLVHSAAGPWDGRLEHARCAAGAEHPAPSVDCCCGLYAWYLPAAATVPLGAASAVVAARGRCILGDRGFRAANARIEAVALPAAVRWHPAAAARARRMLAVQYPQTRVYGSVRRMVRDHPPQDVRELGIDPPCDRSRSYRTAATSLWAAVVLLTGSLALLPREALADTVSRWWSLLVLLTVAWQAALVWLLVRLAAQQGPSPPGFGSVPGGSPRA
jgi:hypothetical protein